MRHHSMCHRSHWQYTCVTGHAGVIGGSDSVGNDNFPVSGSGDRGAC